jgi:RHS repeat-associated protein
MENGVVSKHLTFGEHGNRKWTKRDGGNGDAFGYDLADQVTAVKLDIANPDTAGAGSPTIVYDANGNRTSFAPYGTAYTYAPNNLNQYDSRTPGSSASYDATGNMTTGLEASLYTYDAQNRLISATKNGTTVTFKYDALNRLVIRTINGARYDNIWDGWNLLLTYTTPGNAWIKACWHGPGGMLAEWSTGTSTKLCYSDASGSTTHLADKTTGALLEWYRYDLDGTPIVYAPDDTVRTGGSIYDTRHLFTGQQWYSELGLYDLRNRFYSADIGRFLQPDPIGFEGDRTNLYRYCRNNPIKRSDPFGLADWHFYVDLNGVTTAEAPRQTVTGDPVPNENNSSGLSPTLMNLFGFSPNGWGGGDGEAGIGPIGEARKERDEASEQNNNGPAPEKQAPQNPSLMNPNATPTIPPPPPMGPTPPLHPPYTPTPTPTSTPTPTPWPTRPNFQEFFANPEVWRAVMEEWFLKSLEH